MSMPPRPSFGPPGSNPGQAPMGQRPPGYGSPMLPGPRPGQPGQMVNLPHRQGPAGKKMTLFELMSLNVFIGSVFHLNR